MTVDLVMVNGVFETFDDQERTVDAVAVGDGRVITVGSRADVERLVEASTRIVDLGGAAVLPGFVDTHIHLAKIARDLAMVDLTRASNISDVLDALSAKAGSTRPGRWVRSYGDAERWHERYLAENRLPRREELDGAAPEHPVLLYRRPLVVVLNSRAIENFAHELAGVSRDEWDPESGQLSGDRAKALHDALQPTREEHLEMLASACTELLSRGMTTAVDAGLPAQFDMLWELFAEARASGQLPLRVQVMNRLDDRRELDDELERIIAGHALPLEGDDRVRAWSVKLLLDGEFSNAWRRERGGLQRWSPSELDRLVVFCADRGWPLAVHAIGDAAIDCVLETVARHRDVVVPGRVSIEHGFLIRPEQAMTCHELGVRVSAHTLLQAAFAMEMREAWGATVHRSTPLRTLLDAGVEVAAGSDTLPCEPLRGASIAVTRRNWDGSIYGTNERITPREALVLATRNGGRHLDLPDIGTISPGAHADFSVWLSHPLDIDPAAWPDLRATATIVEGEIVWTDGQVVDK